MFFGLVRTYIHHLVWYTMPYNQKVYFTYLYRYLTVTSSWSFYKGIFSLVHIRNYLILNFQMQQFFLDKGIRTYMCCWVAERKHRHLLEVARALRFQANLPIQFWGSCILTATYLRNGISTPNLSGKTPHELLAQNLLMNIYVSLVVNVMHIIMIQNARSLMHEPPVVYSLAIPMGSVQSF